MTEGRHVHHVGVTRIDSDRSDLLRLLEPHVLPRASAVSGFVNSVARRGVAPDAGLAHSGVDHVGIGLGYRDSAHRAGSELSVGDRDPGEAAVRGFPNPAAGAAEVVSLRLRGGTGHGKHAASAERSN